MDITYRTADRTLHLEPTGRFTDEDLAALEARLARIERDGDALRGLVIRAEALPGFESLSHLFAPSQFLRRHQGTLDRVALCTRSKVGDLTRLLSERFHDAHVATFDFDEVDEADGWVRGGAGAAAMGDRALGARYAVPE